MADAHANFAVSTVATAPSPATSGTSLVVASGEGTRFPATPFNATIAPAGVAATPANSEIVRVTTRTTDTFSVIARAQESSSARTVIVGDRIFAGPTKKTLTDVENANPRVIYPESYGAVGDGSTDDSTAFKNMMAAIDMTYGADIVLDPTKTYVLDSAPVTTGSGNAIVPLPLQGGALGTDATYPFPIKQPHIRIRSLYGTARIKTNRTTDTYSATYGCPSMIGGPTPEVVGAAAEMASIGTVSVEGVVFQVPANPKISALDLWYTRRMDTYNVAFVTDETWDGTAVSVTAPTNIFNFAVRGSYHYGQARIVYDGIHVAGYYAGIVSSQSHNIYRQVIITFTNVAIALDGVTAIADNHPSVVEYLVTHHYVYGIAGWDPTVGSKSLTAGTKFHIYGGPWDIEHESSPWTATDDVLDANNQIYGTVLYHKWPLSVALTYSGASNFTLVDGRVARIGNGAVPNLAALTGTTFTAFDVLPVVDVSDTTQAATGTDKKITTLDLGLTGSVPFALPPAIASAPASSATGSINQYYGVRVRVFAQQFITGVRYRIGGTSNGNVRAALFTNDGATRLGDRSTDQAQGTANNLQSISFDSAPVIGPGDYVALLWFSSATATFVGGRYLGATVNGTQASNTPTTISNPATENADRPMMSLF